MHVASVTSLFVNMSNLKVHERNHTGEKLFQCFKHDKAFTRSDLLKMHEKTHCRVLRCLSHMHCMNTVFLLCRYFCVLLMKVKCLFTLMVGMWLYSRVCLFMPYTLLHGSLSSVNPFMPFHIHRRHRFFLQCWSLCALSSPTL